MQTTSSVVPGKNVALSVSSASGGSVIITPTSDRGYSASVWLAAFGRSMEGGFTPATIKTLMLTVAAVLRVAVRFRMERLLGIGGLQFRRVAVNLRL